MALVERLMKDPSEPDDRHMSVHLFFAAVTMMLHTQITAAQVQAYFEMTAPDLVDWNAIAAQVPAANQTAARALFLEKIHSAFILAESRVPLFSTPAEVRTRLGI